MDVPDIPCSHHNCDRINTGATVFYTPSTLKRKGLGGDLGNSHYLSQESQEKQSTREHLDRLTCNTSYSP